jgi:hypothetical protein
MEQGKISFGNDVKVTIARDYTRLQAEKERVEYSTRRSDVLEPVVALVQ